MPQLRPIPAKYLLRRGSNYHRKRTYESEFETLLRKSGMEFDPAEAFG
jgi:hypothetical protein